MNEPLRLVTTEAQIAESVVEEAEKVLSDAKAGRIDAMLTVARTPGGGWKTYHSGAMRFPEFMGLIELAKIDWANDYLRE